MQLALYRAERPEVFEDIIGQTHIVKILTNQLRSGTIGQSYLFSGTHGTGKTSTARIVAKALNCLNPVDGLPCGRCQTCEAIRQGRFVDVIELDAASNNGVDNLRSIIDLAKYPPTAGKYKVFIIDEVHMLTPAAENAFLKTLEEPPEYAMFILCTTDPQKVNATIRSRCMQLNFRRISEEELIQGLARICKKKQVLIDDEALMLLAQKSDGSVRDALSLLEQTMAGGDSHITRDLVLEYTGCAGDDFYIELTEAVSNGDIQSALLLIDQIMREGKDAKQALKDWLNHYRNLMIGSYVKDSEKILGVSGNKLERIKAQAKAISSKNISRAIVLLSEYINLAKFSDRPRILFETAAVKLCTEDEYPSQSMLGRPKPASSNGANVPGGFSSPKGLNSQGGFRRAQAEAQMQNQMQSQASSQTGNQVPMQAGNQAPSQAGNQMPSQAQRPKEAPPIKFEPPVQDRETELKNRQLAAASTSSGSADDIWKKIVHELSKHGDNLSSTSFLQRYGKPAKFENGELLIYIKASKFELAKDAFKAANELAKRLYGDSVYIVFRPGELQNKADEPTSYSDYAMEKMVQDEQAFDEPNKIIDDLDTSEDDKIEEENQALSDQTSEKENLQKLTDDLSDFFGFEPDITD